MTDPICGKDVDGRTAAAETRYAGETYCFCSEDCYQKFMLDPAKYVGERAEA
jgi:YHS domain-containing protein